MDTGINLNFSFAVTFHGEVLIASTQLGVCYLAFVDDGHEQALSELQRRFPGMLFHEQMDSFQEESLIFLSETVWKDKTALMLDIAGTEFQRKVWQELMKIPVGELTTYREIAQSIGLPKASRAVGTAIGQNPIAILIPCHRVIRSDGTLGGYHWGLERKKKLIEWETSQTIIKKDKSK